MRKKLLTLMLALTLGITLAAMFIGCSNKQQDKDSTTTPPSENIPSTDNDSSTSNEHSHTYSEEWTTDETYHWHAATCEHISEVSDKAPHSWDSGKVTQKSTCTETGIYTYTCTVCGKTKTQIIAATGHTFSSEWTADETYHWHAATCEHISEVSDKTEHIWNDGVVTIIPTCTQNGVKTYTCTICNKTKTQTIVASGHNYVDGFCTICHAEQATPGLTFAALVNGGYCAYDYNGSSSDVIIPSTYNGQPVVALNNYLFNGCSYITSVKLPQTLTTIGNYAFANCHMLQSIIIPKNVTLIGTNTFYNCFSLSEVTFEEGSKLPSISSYMFSGCASLNNVNIPDSVTVINNSAFNKCSSLSNIVIPTSVITINSFAFEDCASLKTIIIPNSVKTCSSSVFYDTNLENVSVSADLLDNIPNEHLKTLNITGGEILDRYALNKSTLLTSVTIADTIKEIGSNAFSYCSSLVNVAIADSVIKIGSYAFKDCTSLTTITVPNGVITIEDNAFSGCTSLTTVTIPNSVITIGSYAFEGCNAMTNITLPFVGATADGDINTHFGYIFGAFSYSSNSTKVPLSLSTVTITGGTEIDDYAFANCNGIKTINLPNSIISINQYAFTLCASLENVNFDENSKLMIIDRYAFGQCLNLKSIEIPKSVLSLGYGAFFRCSKLQNVTFETGSQLGIINEGAFYETAIKSITLPDTVEIIYIIAFYSENCNLTDIYYLGTITQWNNITKQTNWDAGTGNYTIHCKDGYIVK